MELSDPFIAAMASLAIAVGCFIGIARTPKVGPLTIKQKAMALGLVFGVCTFSLLTIWNIVSDLVT